MPKFDPPLHHRTRPIRYLGLHRASGWSYKLYTIAGVGDDVDPSLVELAKERAGAVLPRPAQTTTRYGASFVIVHEATDFTTVVIDWWERVNELRHRVLRAPPDAPGSLTDITASGESVCVWELRVQAFEREAWLDTVLRNPGGPDLGAYFGRHFNEVC